MKLHRIHIVPNLNPSRTRMDGTSNVRLQVNFASRTAYIPLNIWVKPAQWNKRKFVINHPFANNLNEHIRAMVAKYEDIARQLLQHGGINNLTALQVRDKILAQAEPIVETTDARVMDVLYTIADKAKAENTRRLFESTASKVSQWRGCDVRFSDITADWLRAFDEWLLQNGSAKRNARNIHHRNIRRAFNIALRDELTNARYPFREFTIRPEPTPSKAFTAEELRMLFTTTLATPVEQYWVDMLALSFCLIGINMADIVNVQNVTRNHINYTRQKTGKVYSVKLHPVAVELMNRHKSTTHLVDILDKYKDVRIATNACQKHLKAVCRRIGLPDASWYTARYSWASIASSLDISVDTISLALGHTYGRAVTLGYISQDMSKVDKANERVIAEVFGKE